MEPIKVRLVSGCSGGCTGMLANIEATQEAGPRGDPPAMDHRDYVALVQTAPDLLAFVEELSRDFLSWRAGNWTPDLDAFGERWEKARELLFRCQS